MSVRTYRIKEVAEMANISARTLRHYDELGLLMPTLRSAADYRLYTDADLVRLQQILIGRSLGLALEDIRRTLDDPHTDRRAVLRAQRSALTARAEATAKMIRSIDAALSMLEKNSGNTETRNMNMKKLFDGFDPATYEEEAQSRWGHTDSFRESARRTRNYTENDWRAIKAESTDILNDAVALLRANVDSEDPKAMDIAERYRLWVDRWFYPCGRSMHSGLADMYQGDPRFAKYFDDVAPGLASFISTAVKANSLRR